KASVGGPEKTLVGRHCHHGISDEINYPGDKIWIGPDKAGIPRTSAVCGSEHTGAVITVPVACPGNYDIAVSRIDGECPNRGIWQIIAERVKDRPNKSS